MARFRPENDNANKPLAEDHVTPLVDVVLVLLIISWHGHAPDGNDLKLPLSRQSNQRQRRETRAHDQRQAGDLTSTVQEPRSPT